MEAKGRTPTSGTGEMRTRSAIAAHSTQAFTLMELMVVLVLIAVLTAVILPEMRGTHEDAVLRAAGRQFIDGTSLASSRAVALSQTHRLRLDRGTGRYVLERQIGKTHRVARFEPVNDSALAGNHLDPRVRWMLRPLGGEAASNGKGPARDRARVSGNLPDSVRFYADGTADAAELWLEDRMGVRLALRVSPATGRVRVTESQTP
jgi:prepilin-type N-terminal cleavage/methylation domain-containing protein